MSYNQIRFKLISFRSSHFTPPPRREEFHWIWQPLSLLSPSHCLRSRAQICFLNETLYIGVHTLLSVRFCGKPKKKKNHTYLILLVYTQSTSYVLFHESFSLFDNGHYYCCCCCCLGMKEFHLRTFFRMQNYLILLNCTVPPIAVSKFKIWQIQNISLSF